jgi:hypothetical protein
MAFSLPCRPVLARHLRRGSSSEEIVDGKLAPRHPQNTCQRPCDHPHPENETREENRDRPLVVKQLLTALHHAIRNVKHAPVAIEQGSPATIANPVPKVIAEGTRHCANQSRR